MAAATQHIIALGGGGFSMEPENPALDLYVLAHARRTNPSVCFLPTASGDADRYVAMFYAAFARYRCRPSHATFFARTPDLSTLLLAQDVIYVGGGNTKSMLATWREWGVPALLRRAWTSGTVLAGVSAGAICWFDAGVTDSWADALAALPCLGFLSGTCCPHYDGEAERRPALHQLVTRRAVPAALALDDGAAAHFVGRKLSRVVTSRPDARAYRVSVRGRRIVETALPAVPVSATGRLSSRG